MTPSVARQDRAQAGKVNCYTVAQTALITGVPVKNINTYLDRDLSFAIVIGAGFRAVRQDALIAVRLNHEFANSLMQVPRLDVISRAMANPRCKCVQVDDKMTIRVDLARSVVNAGIAKLRAAKAAIVSRNEVLGGEPCIKGTRISAYIVGEMLDECGIADVRDTYPHLSDREIDAAANYASAFPRRGRPRSVESRLEKAKPTRSRVVRVKAAKP